jgi:hypothetical protein
MFLGLVTSEIRMLDANKMSAIFYSKLKKQSQVCKQNLTILKLRSRGLEKKYNNRKGIGVYNKGT